MQTKLLDSGETNTTVRQKHIYIPEEKYAKITRGRNIFFASCISGAALFWGLSMIPQGLMYRSLRRIYQTYCHGKVLDLSPKIADVRDVGFYEMSKAVRVEFLVQQAFVDDGKYKIEESLSEEMKAERRKAMTLDFMVKNDHNWVGSPVTFSVIEEKKIALPDFKKYDTVVIRNELLNRTEDDAHRILRSAATYVNKDGHVLLLDFGKSSWPSLAYLARWFNAWSNSSMNLNHDYEKWIREDDQFTVVERRRCLMGFHYGLVLQLKT